MRSTLPTLEDCKYEAVRQAKRNPGNVVKEFSDVVIVGTQLAHKKAKTHNLDIGYVTKISHNYKNKKKTWDSRRKKVVRK